MKEYKILGWNKNKQLLLEATFKAFDNYMATKKFMYELSNNIETDYGDLYHLMDNGTGEVINCLVF